MDFRFEQAAYSALDERQIANALFDPNAAGISFLGVIATIIHVCDPDSRECAAISDTASLLFGCR
jgi:hypothetical protein